MMKTLEFMGEAIRNPKHPFRKTENQPKKARKNRYERRKIKEFLHLTDILAEEYLVRGLQADAAKMIRKEGKPSRRPIPFQERTQEDGPDGA